MGEDPARQEAEAAALRLGHDLGMNHVDTAEMYGEGGAEAVVAEAIAERRAEWFVVTKVYPHNATRRGAVAACEQSLRRLKTDYIDLYLLHRDDPKAPVGPIVEALNDHRRAGKIRAFGGSNWSHQRIAEANAYAHKHGLTPFVASSPQFSLVEQVDAPWPGCLSIGGADNAAAREWYEDNAITLHAGVRVTTVDREKKLVRGHTGILEPYDVLVFATGSSPFVPPLKGLSSHGTEMKEGLFAFRTIEDCDRMIGFVPRATRAACRSC